MFFYIKKLQDKSRAYRPSFIMILITLIIGTTIMVLAPNKNGSEFLFIFAPLAIIITNYIESIKETFNGKDNIKKTNAPIHPTDTSTCETGIDNAKYLFIASLHAKQAIATIIKIIKLEFLVNE